MCGRYVLFSLPPQIAARFGVVRVDADAAAWRARFNIGPGTHVLAIRLARTGERELVPLRWGFVPHWKRDAEDVPDRPPLVNARSESVMTSPVFRDAFGLRRCLIPADAFYEWRSEPGKRGKQPMLIRTVGHELLAMAGVWDPSHRGETMAVLTRPAVGEVRNIHERMPVIVPESAWSAWLDTAPGSATSAKDLLATWTGPELESIAVSRRVNNAKFDDPACMRADSSIDLDEDAGLFGLGR